MQIAHECPLALMEDSRNWTDYDYALAHLFKDNDQYYQFFVDSIQQGRTVILDNGVFEIGKAMPLDEFAYWINELQPTEYIIPDVLEDSKQTIDNCLQWKSKYDIFDATSIGVVQGRDYDDIVWCYKQLVDLVDKIAISFDYSWYEQLIEADNKYMSWMLGRQQLLHMLNEDNILVDIPHHFLGCSLPQEFRAYYGSPKLRRLFQSIDTSNPVVHGLNHVRYNETGLTSKISTKLVDYMNLPEITFDQYTDIQYNVDKFRRYCNG